MGGFFAQSNCYENWTVVLQLGAPPRTPPQGSDFQGGVYLTSAAWERSLATGASHGGAQAVTAIWWSASLHATWGRARCLALVVCAIAA